MHFFDKLYILIKLSFKFLSEDPVDYKSSK